MPDLPDVRQRFIADTSAYTRSLREAARLADQFGDEQTQAARAAARMGATASESANRAARAGREMARSAIENARAQHAAGRAADDAADNYRQLARDAALAAAAQRLAALRASGTTKGYNEEVGRLRVRFGDLERAGVGSFTEIQSTGSRAFATIGSSGPGAIALTVAALGSVPFVALAAESAISLGVGGALAGMGLAAVKGDAEVKAALNDMTSHVKSQTKLISAPFKQTWMEIARTGRETFDTLLPDLERDFADLAPAVSGFVHDIGYSVTLLVPSFHAATNASVKLMGALGDRAPDIARSLNSALTTMANGAAEHADEFANLVANIAKLLPVAAAATEATIDLAKSASPLFSAMTGGVLSASNFRDALSRMTFGLIESKKGFDVGTGAFPSFSEQATVAAAKAGGLMTAQQAAALSSKSLAQAVESLTSKFQGAFDAETAYKQALQQAGEQAKRSNAGIRGNSAAVIANRQALSSLATTIKKEMEAGKLSAAQIETRRKAFVRMAEGMGVGRREAERLAQQLLGIKPPPPIKLNLQDADFMAKWHRAKGLRLDPKTGLLKGNNSDYFNKWLKAKGLKINPKTGLFKGNNSDYYNKWLKANHLRVDPKTGVIKGNTAAFWRAVHSVPAVVGTRTISVHYAVRSREKTHADGAIERYADGGMRHDLPPHVVYQPTVLYGEPETGGEAYIPLGPNKRRRSTALLSQVADLFGLALADPGEAFAKGGRRGHAKTSAMWASTGVMSSHWVPPKWWKRALGRPQHLSALAAQSSLAMLRRSAIGSWSVGGLGAGIGSGHGTTVQHVTNVNVSVEGSVRSDRDLVAMIQAQLLRGRKPTTLPAGR